MRFQLIAKIKDSELLRKSIHELGTLFYMVNSENKITGVVYFSGSRVVNFKGKLSEELAEIVRADGFQVSSITVDETKGYIKILQAE